MSLTGIIMDVVLMGLLIAALWFGVRLDKRLKALRAAHDGFAKAVGELDDAAIRAHNSLKALRGNAEEQQELLHGRVLAAREVLQKLDARMERAERSTRDLDRGIEAAEAARLMQMQTPVVRQVPETPLTLRNVIATAPLRDRSRRPFDRDVVAEDAPMPVASRAAEPEPRLPQSRFASARAPETRPAGSRLPAMAEPDETDMLDKVQMSELVVANLNDMIRSFTPPVRKAISVEDDLFGDPRSTTK